MKKSNRDDIRTWRDVLAEYHVNTGRYKPVTLPRLEFLEKAAERDERDECAAAA